ncbi:MAG: hypothetical protein J2P48_10205 [Alphaproteobacteria bacterium]|nr:hypothetical protein [Alphaproteobacteria bacterium]
MIHIGSGVGYCTMVLTELVGTSGRVTAVELTRLSLPAPPRILRKRRRFGWALRQYANHIQSGRCHLCRCWRGGWATHAAAGFRQPNVPRRKERLQMYWFWAYAIHQPGARSQQSLPAGSRRG